MLPINQFLPQILNSLSQQNNLVLQAEPGAGKSTVLPLSLIGAEWLGNKKIIMLEPRRVAAKSIAFYLATKLNERVGKSVGYQVKNDRKVSNNTVLEIVTEGVLTRRLQNDPELNDVGLIIFDEFHERSIHSDLALMLALEVQQTIREDLKLLVMSATIDTNLISVYLDDAPIIKCAGRAYPVRVKYIPDVNTHAKWSIITHVIKTLKTVLSDKASGDGDILVFLPGQADIKRCLSEAQKALIDASNIVCLPLYGSLSMDQQERALQVDPSGRTRIIFSTNIAETSLTIEGVTCVIDSGLEKVALYDPMSCMTRLETLFISKASAEQRKGRAGRLSEGTCIRLWSEAKQSSLKEFQSEEVLNADLASCLLDLYTWGVPDEQNINWLTPPPSANFNSAKQVLSLLALVDEGVTSLGKEACSLGIHPRLASMLLKSELLIEKCIACELAALLTESDIFYSKSSVDIVERLLAIQDYKSNKKYALETWPLRKPLVEQVFKTVNSLKNTLHIAGHASVYSLSDLQTHVGKLLLFAYPDRLAKKRTPDCGRYQLANSKGVMLFDDDPLFGSDWLVVSDCNAQKKEGKIFSASAISLDDVYQCLGDLITEKDQYRLDEKKQSIVGRRTWSYKSIVIKSQPIATMSKTEFQNCLGSLLSSEGLGLLNWSAQCEHWLARVIWLGKVMEGFPNIAEDYLLETVDLWLLPYISKVTSLAQLKQVNIFELLKASLTWENQQLLDKEAPHTYVTPSGKKVPITYDQEQGPIVSVKLQEMFGEIASPIIGGKSTPIRFEMLSPALRPIQTTSDLANFWKTSYFDVAKDMRGKYPRHRWPDDPLNEKPGHSIKLKNHCP